MLLSQWHCLLVSVFFQMREQKLVVRLSDKPVTRCVNNLANLGILGYVLT